MLLEFNDNGELIYWERGNTDCIKDKLRELLE